MTARSAGSPTRYALYYAPPTQSALHRLGSAWLGRDAWTGAPLDRPALGGVDPERAARITAAPRRYGFHATLKPPFRLAGDASYDDLHDAVATLAAANAPVAAARLAVTEIGGFVALCFPDPPSGLDALAARCVAALDRFRAPPDAAETARRDRKLTDRQRDHLRRWGYPYVMDEFRFHMTLTGKLADAERRLMVDRLADLFADTLRAPVTVDGLCLFAQRDPERPFQAIDRFPLGGRTGLSY